MDMHWCARSSHGCRQSRDYGIEEEHVGFHPLVEARLQSSSTPLCSEQCIPILLARLPCWFAVRCSFSISLSKHLILTMSLFGGLLTKMPYSGHSWADAGQAAGLLRGVRRAAGEPPAARSRSAAGSACRPIRLCLYVYKYVEYIPGLIRAPFRILAFDIFAAPSVADVILLPNSHCVLWQGCTILRCLLFTCSLGTFSPSAVPLNSNENPVFAGLRSLAPGSSAVTLCKARKVLAPSKLRE
jgi:hypothetical protein